MRNGHIESIAQQGRMAWQRATGYGRRSLVEAAIGRYKQIIDSTLRGRRGDSRTGEAALATKALKRMIQAGPFRSARRNRPTGTGNSVRTTDRCTNAPRGTPHPGITDQGRGALPRAPLRH